MNNTHTNEPMMTAHDLAKIEQLIRAHMELDKNERVECCLAFRSDKNRRMTPSVGDWAEIHENDDVDLYAFEDYFAEFVEFVNNDQKPTPAESFTTQYAVEVYVYTDDALADIYSAKWSGSEWSVKPD